MPLGEIREHDRAEVYYSSDEILDDLKRVTRPQRAFAGLTDQEIAFSTGALYHLLEEEIIPLFYQRSDDGVPHGFVQVMKAAMKSVSPRFSSRRMAKEYVARFYVQALGLS